MYKNKRRLKNMLFLHGTGRGFSMYFSHLFLAKGYILCGNNQNLKGQGSVCQVVLLQRGENLSKQNLLFLYKSLFL